MSRPISLRPASRDDAERLFRWRNDPRTRLASINGDEVLWEAHLRWLTATLANPDRSLLIAEYHGVAVGTIRLDFGPETEISWTVAPEFRGKGIGYLMVAAALPPGGVVVAQIKAENGASKRIAAKAGFECKVAGAIERWSIS